MIYASLLHKARSIELVLQIILYIFIPSVFLSDEVTTSSQVPVGFQPERDRPIPHPFGKEDA